MKSSDEPVKLDENGFPEIYTPDVCDQCKGDMEPMNDYLSLSKPNTDTPMITVFHFCGQKCLRIWLAINEPASFSDDRGNKQVTEPAQNRKCGHGFKTVIVVNCDLPEKHEGLHHIPGDVNLDEVRAGRWTDNDEPDKPERMKIRRSRN